MRDKLAKNSGLTLMEVLVALGIFAVVISVAVGIFVSGSKSQGKISEINATQREASYLMEMISRELRMATAIDPAQQNLKNNVIEFTNYNSNLVKYCKANSEGDCISGAGGKNLSRKEIISGTEHKGILNSSDVEIKELTFYSTDDFNGKQPIITIVMKIRPKDGSDTELILQNSVSLRLY